MLRGSWNMGVGPRLTIRTNSRGHCVVHASSQAYVPLDLLGVYTLHDLSLNGCLLYKKQPHYQSKVFCYFLLFGEKTVTKLVSTTGLTKWQLTL